jgi:hypothetical protein
MSMDDESDEVFDEEELAEGFDGELTVDGEGGDDLEVALVGDEEEGGDAEDEEGDDVEEIDDVPLAPVAVDDDDVIDDADVELALDEVLAETIKRTTTPDDDDETPIDNDPLVDPLEAILPKQDDEFRCKSCRLLKKTSQLADPAKTLCRDCV